MLIVDMIMSWKAHTDHVSSKISRNAGILQCLKHRVPSHTMKMLYNTLVHSYLNHGILAWGFAPGRLVTLQKKAIRAVVKAKYNAHTEPIFKMLKIVKVSDIFILRSLKFYRGGGYREFLELKLWHFWAHAGSPREHIGTVMDILGSK